MDCTSVHIFKNTKEKHKSIKKLLVFFKITSSMYCGSEFCPDFCGNKSAITMVTKCSHAYKGVNN